MTKMKNTMKVLAGVTLAYAFSAGSAFAAGTAAGTSVDNTFTLTYDVNTTPQPPITPLTPTTFVVDRKVDLTVVSTDDTSVAPGETGASVTYTLTNLGNETQAYELSLVQGVDGTDDDFDPLAGTYVITYTVDGGPVQTYTLGDPTIDIPADSVVVITVTANMPAGIDDADVSEVTLVAETLEATVQGPTAAPNPDAGDEVTADGANTLGGVETVLADGTGTVGAPAVDTDNDGNHSGTATFTVDSADVTATKTVVAFRQESTLAECSTFPGTSTGGMSIPGACVEYTIEVVNAGGAAATNVDLTDNLPAELTFAGATRNGFSGGSFSTPTSGADCSAGAGCPVELDGATLAAGATGTVTIRALVQ